MQQMDFIKYTETSLQKVWKQATKSSMLSIRSYYIYILIAYISHIYSKYKYNANTNIQSQTLSSFISSKAWIVLDMEESKVPQKFSQLLY